MHRCLILILAGLSLWPFSARAEDLFRSTDTLAQRDEYGLLHQSPEVNPTDLLPRAPCRVGYYLRSGQELITDPAYVGALKTSLLRLGYYCGPVDGVFSVEVSEAIARLQKNSSQRVTGTLTVPVRRALYLP